MKKLIAILLVLGLCLPVLATTTFSHGHTGKTTVGINYLTWGYFNNASSEAGSLTTGLTTIRAFGLNITSEVVVNSMKTTVSGGTITVYSTTEVTGQTPDGLWWAVGR